MTIKIMLQSPLCGKKQLAAETRMVAGWPPLWSGIPAFSFAHLPAAG
jgi:hypothetical protein